MQNQNSKEDKIEVLFFGSKDCKKCQLMIKEFSITGVSYTYIDILADDTQVICDEQNVNEVPHVQILNDGKKVLEITGYINPVDLNKYLRDAKKYLQNVHQ